MGQKDPATTTVVHTHAIRGSYVPGAKYVLGVFDDVPPRTISSVDVSRTSKTRLDIIGEAAIHDVLERRGQRSPSSDRVSEATFDTFLMPRPGMRFFAVR